MYFPLWQLFSSVCHFGLKKTVHHALANNIYAFILQTIILQIAYLYTLQTVPTFLANCHLSICNYFSCKLSSCELQLLFLQTVILVQQ